jgi:hypothetical protein
MCSLCSGNHDEVDGCETVLKRIRNRQRKGRPYSPRTTASNEDHVYLDKLYCVCIDRLAVC